MNILEYTYIGLYNLINLISLDWITRAWKTQHDVSFTYQKFKFSELITYELSPKIFSANFYQCTPINRLPHLSVNAFHPYSIAKQINYSPCNNMQGL